MDDVEGRLAAFYDLEAPARAARPLDPRRVEARDDFVALVLAEGRRTVLEVGTGPGLDAVALDAAGLTVIGIDRSLEPARLARRSGVAVVQASVGHLPCRRNAVDAGWTMSTLVHVSDEGFDDALAELVAALRPGAPVAVGLWGGIDHEGWLEGRDGLPGRFFSVRSHERTVQMLGRHGTVERFDTWDPSAPSGWSYQLAVLRVDG